MGSDRDHENLGAVYCCGTWEPRIWSTMSEVGTPNTSTPGSVEQSVSQGETFLDEEGWKDEAKAIIKDISDYVELICVSEKLPSCRSQIFLNLITKEAKTYTIALNLQGFKVVGESLNTADIEGETIYETPYSLLDNLSPGYRQAFGNKLTNQLLKLQKLQEESGQSD